MIIYNEEQFTDEEELMCYKRVRTEKDKITKSELLRKSKPTPSDITETKTLLKDFGCSKRQILDLDFESFSSVRELHTWRKDYIKQILMNGGVKNGR